MKKTTLGNVLLVVMLGGCASPGNGPDADAQTCEMAVRVGRLDVADEMCQRALAGSEKGNLAPAVRSERLYNLARIKRQRGEFLQAGELLDESLSIEETLSGADSPGVTRRLIEMSLVLAAQDQWQQGAQVLERVVPLAYQLTEKERASLGNIVRRYVAQLKGAEQEAQAARLEAAVTQLNAE